MEYMSLIERRIPYIKMPIIAFFVLLFSLGIVVDYLNFPHFLNYTFDLVWMVALMVLLLNKGSTVLKKRGASFVSFLVIAFLLFSLLSAVVNLVDFPLVLYALRNALRFYVMFLYAICYLNRKDIDKMIKVLLVGQVINLVVIAINAFVFNIRGDHIAGLMGKGMANLSTLISMTLVCYYLNMYIHKFERLSKLVFVLIVATAIAVIAEEKAFFFMLVVVFLICLLLNARNRRSFISVALFAILGYAGLYLMEMLFPVFDLDFFFNLDRLINYGSSAYHIDRINPFFQLQDQFMPDIMQRLLGLGFGNCEHASFIGLESEFYIQNKHMHYMWFSHSMRFIETGYIGLFMYLFVFVYVILFSLSKYRKQKISSSTNDRSKALYAFGFTYGIFCIMAIWMANSLGTDTGVLGYIFLAVPFIGLGSNANPESE